MGRFSDREEDRKDKRRYEDDRDERRYTPEEFTIDDLGDTEYRIVKAIERSTLPDDSVDYLIDVMLEIESVKEASSETIITIAKDIAAEYKFKFLGEGTSRIAILDKDDNVLKFSHRRLGDVDNKFEKAITKLVENGNISKVAADRLALCFDVDMDTDWVIAQEEFEGLSDRSSSDDNRGRAAVKYILQNYQEYKDMIQDLEEEIFLCDVHPKRAFNIGLGSKEKMVVIDYGLCIPLCVIDNGTVLENGVTFKKDRFYCSCGKEIHYDIPKVDGHTSADIDDITDKGSAKAAERYFCNDCRKPYDSRAMYRMILDQINMKDVDNVVDSRKSRRR